MELGGCCKGTHITLTGACETQQQYLVSFPLSLAVSDCCFSQDALGFCVICLLSYSCLTLKLTKFRPQLN